MSDQSKSGDQPIDDKLEKEITDALGDFSMMDLLDLKNEPTATVPETSHSDDPSLRNGVIVAVHGDDVFVDIGGKSQGIISLVHFDKPPKIGSTMEFTIEGLLRDEGLLKLSRKGAIEKADWQSLKKGLIVEGVVTGTNTGGLELKIANQKAFMPSSQIDFGHVENIGEYLNKKLKCQITDIDRRKKNIVVSRRAVLNAEREDARKVLLKELEVGQIREGKIRSIQKFGAFVDLGGLDGLIHISDLSYSHVDNADDIVKIGETLQVKILKVDIENGRIALGLKQVHPDPWVLAENKYVQGSQVTGRITRIADFGAFVELEPGIEALLPIGELSWQRVKTVDEVVQMDQVISAVVLNTDFKRQRIGISLKKLQNDPWESAALNYMPDSIVTGCITRTMDFGAFLLLEPGIEGLIHISELREERTDIVDKVVKVGQEVKVKVLSVDPAQRRISLSIKALTEKNGRSEGNASRSDVKKYITSKKDGPASSSLMGGTESLLGKWGDPNKGGLKGGIG